MTTYDVIIIGSGPAGLTTGIYTSRANLKTLLLAGEKWGGQLQLTTLVENYPGFPEGIQGPDLMTNMRKQAEKFGVQIMDENVTGVEFINKPYRTNTTNGTYMGKAIIIATGAEFKWLGLPSEQKLIGRGVSSCATCDAAFFKDKKVVVVGGGDAAMEEALVLTKFASEVTIVHRRGEFRASKIMQDRIMSHPKIKVEFNVEVVEVLGENKVEGVKFKNGETLYCDGLFVAIGHSPATKIFEGKIDLDEKKYATRKFKTMSNVEGVFVAGDVHDHVYRQAITAAGYGCEAAIDADRWLTENGHTVVIQ
ncbi:MAG: thioredoxin reductase (NADPH) [Microgenomates group bacterium Gr01-1014_16]|nr:MAG: thioredoxin reductase (NADPH) [Microgenomates group bacterium Gr01-1014_16]